MQLIQENFDSKNLFEKIGLLTEQQQRDIEKGLQWIDQNYGDVIVVGGIAVVNYLTGSRTLTPDLDVMVNDLDHLKSKLDEQEINYENLINNLGITVPQFNTDFLDVHQGNFEINKLAIGQPNVTTIFGYKMKIIKPELLTIMKLELGRNKDLGDGLALLQSGKIDKVVYEDFLYKLKDNLNEFESLKSYLKFIM